MSDFKELQIKICGVEIDGYAIDNEIKIERKKMINLTEDMKKFLNDKGLLPTYAWPGGYQLFYMDGENNVLCPKCANENDEFSSPLCLQDVNWEQTDLYCDHCNEQIEAAYN